MKSEFNNNINISDSWNNLLHVGVSSQTTTNSVVKFYNGDGYSLPHTYTLKSSDSIHHDIQALSCFTLYTNPTNSVIYKTNTYTTTTSAKFNIINTDTSTHAYITTPPIANILTNSAVLTDDANKTGVDRQCANYTYLNACKNAILPNISNDYNVKLTTIGKFILGESNTKTLSVTVPNSGKILVLACANAGNGGGVTAGSHSNDTGTYTFNVNITAKINTSSINISGVTSATVGIGGYGQTWRRTTGGCDKRSEAFTQKAYGMKNVFLWGYINAANNKGSKVQITINNATNGYKIIALEGTQFSEEFVK